MENAIVTGDESYRAELTNHIAEAQLKSAFEHRYGRGWQRKLGAVLDVPETTVNGWFKSGRFPPLAKLAFGVLLSRSLRQPGNWTPVKNGARYAVCDTEGPIGRIVADHIASADDATLLAAAPQLLTTGCDVFDVLNDARDYMDGWGELADKLEAAIDAALIGRTTEMDPGMEFEPAIGALRKLVALIREGISLGKETQGLTGQGDALSPDPDREREAVERNPGNGWRVARLITKASSVEEAEALYRDFMSQPHKADEVEVFAAYYVMRALLEGDSKELWWECVREEEQRGYDSDAVLGAISRLEKKFRDDE